MSPEIDIFAEFARPESGLNSNQDRGGEATVHAKPSLYVEPEPRQMFNARQPSYVLKAERPEHRAIIMMKASGMSNVEIASAIGKTAIHVAYVVKQPWAQEQILREIESAGREPVLQLLRVSAFDAAQRLINIAETAENLETKRKANNDILDRVFGKATQPIAISEKSATEFSDDELAKIAAQGKKN